jgi:hypothetical protein
VSFFAAGVREARVSWVADAEYFPVASRLIARARYRALCSVFIVDPDVDHDPALRVDSLLFELECARWRGGEARLLIGGSHDNLEIARACFAAVASAKLHRVPARWLTRRAVRGSHAKLVIVDSTVLTGSHNWSGGAMDGQVQDSVLVESAPLAARLARVFAGQWARADGKGATA